VPSQQKYKSMDQLSRRTEYIATAISDWTIMSLLPQPNEMTTSRRTEAYGNMLLTFILRIFQIHKKCRRYYGTLSLIHLHELLNSAGKFSSSNVFYHVLMPKVRKDFSRPSVSSPLMEVEVH
jgi:hypothetical protein